MKKKGKSELNLESISKSLRASSGMLGDAKNDQQAAGGFQAALSRKPNKNSHE